MFSGIVEATSSILQLKDGSSSYQLIVERPRSFDDIGLGDSICTDGVCLTIEAFDEKQMQFTLGYETLKVVEFDKAVWLKRKLNLERSIRFGDRVHGHLVTGHVDGLGVVTKAEAQGDNWLMNVQLPQKFAAQVWQKGSITLGGVSLTVNGISKVLRTHGPVAHEVEVCLIPETIQRTNLTQYRVGEKIHFETDYMAKALLRQMQVEQEDHLGEAGTSNV